MQTQTLPDRYRAVNKTDVVEIKRNPGCKFDPEPTCLPKEFRRACEEYGDDVALVSKDDETYSFRQYYSIALQFAKSLVKIGAKVKDCVAVIGFNSPEYHFSLHGTWIADCITTGIYTTNSEEACKYVLDHSESIVCVCQSGAQLNKIISISESVPSLKAIVVYWPEANNPTVVPGTKIPVYTWEQFLKVGEEVKDEEVYTRTNVIKPGSCATLIYTSGTTGDPKAVMCSHDNCCFNALGIKDTIGLKGHDRICGFLPLNHVAAQYVDVMLMVFSHITIHLARPDALKGTLVQSLVKCRPTVYVAVPRVYEKMYEGIREKGAANSRLKKRIAAWARGLGLEVCRSRQYGQTVKYPAFYGLAKKLVLDNVREQLGFGDCRAMVVSAAPASRETIEFFASFDMPVYDLLGQSEATAPLSTCTPVGQVWKMGTVGQPMPGVEIQIDPANSEIMYRGRNTMMGYLKNPTETLAVLDSNGFIHTGDQGSIDSDKFLTVTGRIKELIITAGGENVSPLLIENKLMSLCNAISICMAVGDKRKFISLLICLRSEPDANGEPTERLSKESLALSASIGSDAKTTSEAARCPKYKQYFDSLIEEGNKAAVSRASFVRKWIILPLEFSVSKGELTATMKMRRGVIHKMYESEINSMFDDAKSMAD